MNTTAVGQSQAGALNTKRCRIAYSADSLELDAICGAVVLGIVAEDGGAVEGAVVLWEVQPALEAVRAVSSDTQTNDVRRAAAQTAVRVSR